MIMKRLIWWDDGLKKYKLLVLEEHAVPGLCTNLTVLSHMKTYVHSGNMAIVQCLTLFRPGFFYRLKV